MALLVALSGTTYAVNGSLPGKNTVGTSDIIDGEVRSPDVRPNHIRSSHVRNDDLPNGGLLSEDIAPEALTGADVADGSLSGPDIAYDSLTGDDVHEFTLGTVPSAALGGTGRGTVGVGSSCDPESYTYVNCLTYNLPVVSGQARFLLIGGIRAATESGSDTLAGSCQVRVDGNLYRSTMTSFHAHDPGSDDVAEIPVTLSAVTDPLPSGPHEIRIECNQYGVGAIQYYNARMVSVALSAS